ncbi:hypothetical protein GEMRC1_006339 [Eukaryota sp. GEM-RC1]
MFHICPFFLIFGALLLHFCFSSPFIVSTKAFDELVSYKSTALNAYLLFPKDDPSNALVVETARFNIRQVLLSIDEVLLKNSPRTKVIDILRQSLVKCSRFQCAWAAFESDQYDDSDFGCSKGHDKDGRFTPMVYRENGRLEVGAMPDVDREEFYNVPKETGRFHRTEPYSYDFGGFESQLVTVCSPIFKFGRFVGSVGFDIFLKDVESESDFAKIELSSQNANLEGSKEKDGDLVEEESHTSLGKIVRESEARCKLLLFLLAVTLLALTLSSLIVGSSESDLRLALNNFESLSNLIADFDLVYESSSLAQKFAFSGNPLYLSLYAELTHRMELFNAVFTLSLLLDDVADLGEIQSLFENFNYFQRISL